MSGAVGAMTSEVIAEAFDRTQVYDRALQRVQADEAAGLPVDRTTYERYLKDEFKTIDFASKAGSILTASSLGHNPAVAQSTATTAIENNFFPGLMAVGLVMYDLYDIAKVYQLEGAEAAQDQALLHAAGWVAGGVVAKGITQALKAGRPVLGVLLEHFPQMERVMERAGIAYVAAEQKVLSTSVGQALHKADRAVVGAASRLAGKAEARVAANASGTAAPKVMAESSGARGETLVGEKIGTAGKAEAESTLHPRVRKINGRLPINHEYAGKTYTFDKLPQSIKEKYPNLQRDYQHGIPFTGSGFADFSRYAIKKVEINFSGKRGVDDMLANAAAGYKSKPIGYTWHHHHDGKTMLLLPSDLHDAFKHTGGFSIK